MSPILAIKPKDRRPGWLQFDLRDDKDVGAIVVFPAFGPNHHALGDCWCHPDIENDGELVIHNEQH